MEHKLKQFVDIYRGLLRHPEFASACISNSSTDKKIKLQTRWTQHDLERKEKISFNRDYLVKYEKVYKKSTVSVQNFIFTEYIIFKIFDIITFIDII